MKMAGLTEESKEAVTIIDESYEFSAPHFFDFVKGESEEDMHKAELWFETALSYAPSPFMPRIKTGRSFKLESVCNFSEAADQMQKTAESSDSTSSNCSPEIEPKPELATSEIEVELIPHEEKEEESKNLADMIRADKDISEKTEETPCTRENESISVKKASLSVETEFDNKENINPVGSVGTEDCTPKPLMPSRRGKQVTDSKQHHTTTKIASMLRNPSAKKQTNPLQLSHTRGIKPANVKRDISVKNTTGTPSVAQENQAIKRQKLEGGKSRQILNVKPHNFPHKTKSGLISSSSNLCPSTAHKTEKENRKVYVRENAAPVVPFVSTAEMIKKFQSSTRDLSLPLTNTSISHNKPRLTLTRPKEPELETSQRIRSVRVKSSAELEEEMMAKIPKFKARPLNKKILEAPTLPALQRSAPQPPEFQEFHFETMARANQNAETSSVASTEVSRQNNQWRPHLTEPKTPTLQTSLRARPPKVKSSLELEHEELEKIPKFKARPLNKKIFESKGELGVFCNEKKEVTKPQEFHFATNERIPLPAAVVDLFDKLSLNSEPHHDNPLPPRNTRPNPFHLHTEERGAEKEKKFVMEVIQKKWEEERARIPKANPYPYTTDFPLIPPRPEPKQYTKPEPFQLESLVRHEEEMQREMEERLRIEKEEAKRRTFKAQPILKEDPIPVPEKVRKPLTTVQEFHLHVNHRAVDRAEFDQRVKEKEMMYKRYREESEAARMIEEEKALKQMRRTMVPHARPVPSFDHPFCPQKSTREMTKPKSPNLRVLRRKKERRRMEATCPVAAISSPATNMR
ncbi:protein TPX2 [Carica papaya]|uniref:protein TPX2 n=1 Tax=Carica papaya TaxID=3649 RepID=UPI000B8D1826|nr:protein TPX2 [Carica papaya]